ncbi:hypothetical protein Val02_39620 [Virgisporangium aliadipatigenens]|uniref:Nucleoside phosphorylase domain-containing protein n=1 Tax=Virgisporangium aliadipatigenens TaxID=741659 RepID=A0A8J3YNK4_9ACTN|nr:5'-methylthioadenosine/S-adenosylhomocysteine nucleosidase [Virgisporangium aliadipatigenens]GIJ47076.1 hypothetical protein Val02_39620 [Virgisporangium aliadipatigenens]
MSRAGAVVLTALDLEYRAMRAKLRSPTVHWHPKGTRFEVGRLAGDGCRVALGLSGKGNHSAAALTERAIAEFAPSAVIFVGVAGGLWPSIGLGDVVVASHVYAYHGGTSEDDGLKARPRVWEIPHRAGQIAQHVIRMRRWAAAVPGDASPTAHFGPIAAGEVVLDSGISAQAEWVRTHYNDALAIEMEAAGVAQACHLNDALPVVVVRGISDHADGTKVATDGERWQPRAVAHAVEFVADLVPELVNGLVAQSAPDSETPAVVSSGNYNVATGNARVGVQAGTIHGGLVYAGAPARSGGVEAGVDALRDRLRDAHQENRLDEAVYRAAVAELDGAMSRHPNAGEPILSLMRLRGLVADLPDVARAVADLADAVRGAS